MSAPAAAELLADFQAVMAAHGWPWYVFGAQAVVAYGLPRMTADVDITVRLHGERIRDFVTAMAKSGFDLRVSDPDRFIAETRVFPFVHKSTHMPLDVVLAGPGLEDLFFERSQQIMLGSLIVPMIGPEDLIVTKILAGRPKDLEDVAGILKKRRKTLNMDQVREMLAAIESALGQSDLTPILESILAKAR